MTTTAGTPAGTRAPAAGPRPNRHLAGTGTLLRLALRRDRVMLPAWVLTLGLITYSTKDRLESMYATAAERADLVENTNGSGATRALFGPAFGDSLGALTAWRVGGFLAVGAGIMSVLLVVRHTREEEETGRQEALASGMVGRRAGVTAALLTAVLANAATAVLVTGPLLGEDPAGAVALGLSVGLTGLVFAALAAVAAQFTENARLARGIALGALGIAFLLRMAGDAARDATTGSGHVLGWLSPLGWAGAVRPFAGDRWWPLALSALLTAVSAAVAHALVARRDIGTGFWPARPGPASAGPALGGVYGLAWRLQRGSLLGWAVGMVFAGAVLGSIADGVGDIIGDNTGARDLFRRMGGQEGVSEAFLAAMVSILGLVTTVYTAGSVLRLRGEETGQRAEPLLSHPVGRLRWAGSHLLIAYLGPAVLLAAGGLALGIGFGAATGDLGGELPPVLAAMLAQLPAVWVITGLAVLVVGLLPQLSPAVWGVVGAVVAIGWLGPAADLPQWVVDVSPFGHLPKLPGGEVSATPFLWLTGLSVVLPAAGLAALRHRDLAS
ncbi:ABC transporter permease [Streptomyces pactum]|uniref:ABC transporter permease n=1 Tax=Streptomyces pactum TaxID=68249 RepID=A0ABS0NLV6_9ACTN|nr:ABC transporter permease [Streptomyces pactum]MBH5336173.1 ABC transporter permease [Streptomyces pactum]